MQIKSLCVFAFLPVLLFAKTTPAQIENDISHELATALAGDLTALEAFPVDGPGTLDEVMAIHAAHLTTNNVIVSITNDVDDVNCPLSDSDASTILTLLKAQVATLQQAFMDAAAREPALAALGVIPLFQGDFAILQPSADALAAAIGGCVSVCPSPNLFAQIIDINQSNILPEAEAVKSTIDDAFAAVNAAFGSS
ncbi:hypothetical protein C0992_012515 [Termitomyces sp. T32_za158]|nr:hypothetical protein C0992_012515 [Termitomyces sp. T32_za158]